MRHSQRIVDPDRVLTRCQLAAVLSKLLQLCEKSQNARLNRKIMRHACRRGLLVSPLAAKYTKFELG